MNNKEEFLRILQECLEESIPKEELLDTLAYYREYFAEEMSHGKTEEEILQSIGSPRLIAHSILDVHEETDHNQTSHGGYYDMDEETYHEEGELTTRQKVNYLTTRVGIVAGLIAILVVVAFLLKAFLPVIVVGLVIYGISQIIRG